MKLMSPGTPGFNPDFLDARGALYVYSGFDLNRAGNYALVSTFGPGAAYAIGSAQIVLGSAIGTAVVRTVVSNSPLIDLDSIIAHPDDNGDITLAGTYATTGMPLEHAYFGVQVTTAAGAACVCDLFILLKA